MKINFEDQEWTLDLNDITVAQAKVIKVHRGLTLKALSQGLDDLDPDALVAVYWLMKAQSGQTSNIDQVDFRAIKFALAVGEAANAEAKADAEAAKASESPKE